MSSFILTIQLSSTYQNFAPALEILVDGVVAKSVLIEDNDGSPLDYSTSLEYSSTSPSISFHFPDDGAESGRQIYLQSIQINGQALNASQLPDADSSLTVTLGPGQSSFLNDGSFDGFLGEGELTIDDFGSFDITADDGGAVVSANNWDDSIAGSAGNDDIRGRAGNDSIYAGDGNDQVKGHSGDDIIAGGLGNDNLEGDTGNDFLSGNEGADFLSGAAGQDIIYGGTGDDKISGGDDTDTLFGGAGADRIFGNAGDDYLYGENGSDELYGLDGDDNIHGGAGIDNLFGGDGNDDLYGGEDFDRVSGGAGDDTLDGGAGDDKIVGGDGNDTLVFASATAGVNADLGDGFVQDDGTGGQDKVFDVENVDGTLYRDFLNGDDGSNIINGYGGNDVIFGRGGNDIINAGDGWDRIDGGAGDDTISGGAGNDRLIGGEGNDILLGGAGDDSFGISAGSDTQDGGDGNDVLLYDSDDIFIGGAGTDFLRLESGDASTIDITADVSRFSGIDTIRLNNKGAAEVSNTLILDFGDIANISDDGSLYVTSTSLIDNVQVNQLDTTADFAGSFSIGSFNFDHYSKAGLDLYIHTNLNLTATNGSIAFEDSFTVDEDTALTFSEADLLSNDNDASGGGLDIVSYTTPSNGSLSFDGTDFTYNPDSNYFGTDSFTYTIEDSDGATSTTTVTLDVASVNDVPVAQDDVFTGDEGAVISGNLLTDNANGADSDADSTDILSVITTGIFITAKGNSVTISENGDFVFTPSSSFIGNDTFTYTISDGNGGQDTATVTLNLAAASPPSDNLVYFISNPGDTIPNSNEINTGGPYDAKTLSVSFTTDADVTSRQVIYEQGGSTRGMNIFIENGEINFAAWNYAEENWGYHEITTSISGDTFYTGTIILDGALPADGSITAYLDGTEIGSQGGVGLLYAHGDDVGIGEVNGSTVINDTGTGSNNVFAGSVNRVAQYNSVLEGEDLDNLHDIMAQQTIEPVLVQEDLVITTVSNSDDINTGGPYDEKTLSATFTTGSDITNRQVVYEQGGTVRGMNMFIENGKLYTAAWNYAEENWGYQEFEADIAQNQTFTVTLVLDGELPENGILSAYINGTKIGDLGGVGLLYAHPGQIGFAEMVNGSVFHGSSEGGNGFQFTGTLDKIAQYNHALTGSSLDQLHAFMSGIRDSAIIDPTITDPGTIINGTTGDDVLTGDSGDNQISGGLGNDDLLGQGGNDILDGGAGNDRLYGGDGDDALNGGGGDDILFGNAGNDTLDGGAGNDELSGLGGSDILNGQEGTDNLYGGDGNDTLNGGADFDRLSGDDGDDLLDGGLGGDLINGGAGIDTVRFQDATNGVDVRLDKDRVKNDGSGDADDIYNVENVDGTAFVDSIVGSASDNVLRGGEGNDTLIGQGGNDTLYGDEGIDTLTGGSGADVFTWSSSTFDTNVDIMQDFAASEGDILDISDILTGFDGTSDINDYLDFSAPDAGGTVTMSVDIDGTGSGYAMQAVADLLGQSGGLDAQTLFDNGNVIA